MCGSLYRVTWGFTLAVLIGVPFGLFLGCTAGPIRPLTDDPDAAPDFPIA